MHSEFKTECRALFLALSTDVKQECRCQSQWKYSTVNLEQIRSEAASATEDFQCGVGKRKRVWKIIYLHHCQPALGIAFKLSSFLDCW